MSSIIVASVPVHGHVTPLLTVARRLVARGDTVRFLTGARFADVVSATGATHVPLPADADFDDRQDWNATFPERAALKRMKAITFDIEHIFIRPARPQYEALWAAHAAEPADAVICDPAFGGASVVLGHPRATRPVVVVAGVLPLSLASPDVAPWGMGLAPLGWGPLNRVRNRLLAGVSRRMLSGVQAIGDAMHQEVHGRPLPFPVLDWNRHADAILPFTVPSFEYPRSDAPGTVHFVGPLNASGSVAPLPAWWGDLDGSRPVVHVTQGTIANKDVDQLIGPALRGLADEDVLVVVATGGRPLDTLPPLPANARAAEYLPYDELLPKTDVFVTNGGYGGVQYALRFGVPIVVTGGKEDKPEVGARVAWSGVGRRFRTETPSPAALRKAVLAVLGDDRYRTASRAMAAEMAAVAGFEELTRVVDGLVGHPGGRQAGALLPDDGEGEPVRS
jgi:UDP:flavonoid glycosyltransferase YjiC (YdhE family)